MKVSQVDPRYAVQFIDGYHVALQVGAAILFAGAVVAVLAVRQPRHAAPPRAADAAVAASARFGDAA